MKKNTNAILFLMIFLLPVFFSRASDVFVSTDFSAGKGILRNVGDNCFVYTPKHVIEDADNIYVSSALLKDITASLLTTYPIDLAILQLPKNDSQMCRQKSWTDDNGDRVSAVLNGTKEATLSFRKKNGALTEYKLNIIEKELHTFFYVELSDSQKSIIQGMSGSIVMVGQYPIGMLLSINNGVGKVLRVDAINDMSKSVMASFSSDIALKAKQSSDLAAYSNHSNSVSNTNDMIYQGKIAKGITKEYKVIATGNTAYRLTSHKQSDDVRVKISFLAPNGKRLFYDTLYTGKKDVVWGFGTPDEGEHILRIEGDHDGGQYHLQLEEMATPEQLVGKSNHLENGDIAKGYIGQGTYAEYKIITTGNTAYRLTSQKQSDDVRVKVSFLAPNGKRLFYDTLHTGKKDVVWGFGTPDEGEHILKIEGDHDGGHYYFQLEEIATPEQLVGKSNHLANGDIAKGYIAQGTYAEYKVTSKANTTYRLTSKKQSDDVKIQVNFVAPNGKRLFYKSLQTGRQDISWELGTPVEGEHILRIEGNSGGGNYYFQLEEYQ